MGGKVLQNLTAPNNGSIQILNTVKDMIIFVSVLLKDIVEQQRDFVWERPPCCPRCDHYKVWSHGFTERNFDGFDIPLLLKCYRCPHCGCVITMRPDTHFPRFQASKNKIFLSLSGMPVCNDVKSSVALSSYILKQMSQGKLSPTQAHLISGIVEKHLRCLQLTDVEQRLEDIEARLEKVG